MSAIHRDPRWPAVRLKAKRRDGWACVRCRRRGKLEVDHITPARHEPERAFDLAAVQTLCVPCHVEKTRLERGTGEHNPAREAWKSLVNEITNPSNRKELQCLSQ